MKLSDVFTDMKEKAGFIPYVIEEGEPVFLFMTPSNALFGGSQPCIAKGGVDKGENVLDGAIREAKEELGLKKKNIKKDTVVLVFSGMIRGKKSSYKMTVFTGEVKSKDDFGKFTYETKSIHWLKANEFTKQGLPSHHTIVRRAHRIAKSQNADVAQ